MRTVRLVLVAACSLVLTRAALAQGQVERTPEPAPARGEDDRNLDDALRRAHGDPAVPPPSDQQWPTPRPGAVEPPAPAPPPPPKQDEARESLKVTLGFMATYWSAQVVHASVGSRGDFQPDPRGRPWRDSYHDDRAPLDGGSRSVADLDRGDLATFRGWIDLGSHLGPYFTVEASGFGCVLRDTVALGRDLRFNDRQFLTGQDLSTKLELVAVDVNVVGHFPIPGAEKLLRLDADFGLRYLGTHVRFRSAMAGLSTEQGLESAFPTFGLGVALSPIRGEAVTLELSARARVGADPGFHATAGTLQTEVAVTLTLFDTIGVTVGHRFEASEIVLERELHPGEVASSYTVKRVDWALQGPYVGLVLQF